MQSKSVFWLILGVLSISGLECEKGRGGEGSLNKTTAIQDCAKHTPRRIENMYARIAVIRTALDNLRGNSAVWNSWLEIDREIEKTLRASDVEFMRRVQWSDPEVKGNYLQWLLEDLARNAEYLVEMGKNDEAQYYLIAAEELSSEMIADGDVASLLIANTLARFVMAAWRDISKPQQASGELKTHTEWMLLNIKSMRLRIQGSPFVKILSSYPMPNFTASNIADAPFSLTRRPKPKLRLAGDGKHSPVRDDFIFAINLPSLLSPPNTTLADFLNANFSALPNGEAVLLGSGDGCEPREVARYEPFTKVYAVDHSPLVSERIEDMKRRLTGHEYLRNIQSVNADVTSFEFPKGAVNLIVANHLIEFINDEDRLGLLRRAAESLKPGGMFFLNVHLAEGVRFNALSNSGTVEVDRNNVRVKHIARGFTDNVPQEAHIKHFFFADGFLNELAAAGISLQNGLIITAQKKESGDFVELIVIIYKRPSSP